MKALFVLMLAAALTACAGTKAGPDGLRMQGNARYVKYERTPAGAVKFEAHDLNHSEPTRAGVEYVRTLTGALVPVATSFFGGNTGAAGVGVSALDVIMRKR